MQHNSRNPLQPCGDYGNDFVQNSLPSLLIPAFETNELLHLNELVGGSAQALLLYATNSTLFPYESFHSGKDAC